MVIEVVGKTVVGVVCSSKERREEGSDLTKQLVIALDAMEWTLVDRWARAGTLPTLRRLMDEGAHGELASTAAQFPDTVWTTIYTGVNPGYFEKYFYVKYEPATLGLKIMSDDATDVPMVWEHLSHAGRRVAVVDPAEYGATPDVNGVVLVNWGAHGGRTPCSSRPPALRAEVRRRLGAHPVGECDAVDQNPRSLHRLRQRVLDGVRRQGELHRWLVRDQSWDVFFAGFSAPHCIGHHCWDEDMTPLHGEASDGLSGAVEQIYRAIDEEVGRMLVQIGDDVRVMVVSGHGMGPLYHASWSLPEILERLGYAASPPGPHVGVVEPTAARVNFWRVVKMVVPGRVQYAIKGMLPKRMQDELVFRWYAGRHDWKGHRAFAVPNNDSVGAVRVSVRGRDAGGLVEPGREYEALCRDIADALAELRDPVSGRPVARLVTLTRQVFHGPFVDTLPDITVLWDQSFAWDTITSERVGTLRIRRLDRRLGTHTPRGFVLMRGPGIAPGSVVTGGSIYDIAPTLLAGAGVPIPAAMEGKPFTIA